MERGGWKVADNAFKSTIYIMEQFQMSASCRMSTLEAFIVPLYVVRANIKSSAARSLC
jgi:hypothetical protein